MTRIAILSDLHFGFHRTTLVHALLHEVNETKPDFVVIAGDLTHRGQPDQYVAARQFLDGLDAPWGAIPGNHDVPLWPVTRRVLRPWSRWRRNISRGRAFAIDVGQVRVQGIDSVDRFAWQRGVVPRGVINRLLRNLSPQLMNLIVMHHPLEHLPGIDKFLARGATQALNRLADAGAQIAVTGHLHLWSVGELPDTGPQRLLQIQMGTALCNRPGDRRNEFCTLDIAGPDLTVTRHIAPMTQTGFLSPIPTNFTRIDGLWHRDH
ncbi:MAG: metallophosphoesterase [Paracoccus denitrificans]|nr:MAG: metallophosphoesterase [Paracoccus denitrificans]PZO84169.1 MAG: metallophosphoesterase [Paracoccus denitrificans]